MHAYRPVGINYNEKISFTIKNVKKRKKEKDYIHVF